MKSRLNKNFYFCLFVSALLLTSCGKKENKVSSNYSGSSPFTSNNPALSSSVGSTIINQVSSVKANVGCLNGGYRLTNDVSFYVNGGYKSGTTIGGNWANGF